METLLESTTETLTVSPSSTSAPCESTNFFFSKYIKGCMRLVFYEDFCALPVQATPFQWLGRGFPQETKLWSVKLQGTCEVTPKTAKQANANWSAAHHSHAGWQLLTDEQQRSDFSWHRRKKAHCHRMHQQSLVALFHESGMGTLCSTVALDTRANLHSNCH